MLRYDALLIVAAEVMVLGIAIVSARVPQFADYFDKAFLSTVFLSAVVGILSNVLKKTWMNLLEDNAKLTANYGSIIGKYSEETGWLRYDNAGASEENRGRVRKDESLMVTLPVIVETSLGDVPVIVKDDRRKRYALPEELVPFASELMAAHDTSNVYNQLNIRVDDWGVEDGLFVVETSRTTYFSSLMTNRAMDYKLSNYMTVRDMVQYGPFLPSVGESVLSNHLGFNGLIISSDGKFPIVKRSKEMSIAKRTYGPSVAASLKAKYCLNEDRELTVDGILNSMVEETEDELKIPRSELIIPNDLSGAVVCAYRDIVEGNKPQLMFVMQCKLNSEEIHANFMKAMRAKAKSKAVLSSERRDLEDGDKLEWISLGDWKDACFMPDRIIVRGKEYPMVPSAVATVMLAGEKVYTRDLFRRD